MTRDWYRVRTLDALGTALAQIRHDADLNQTDAAVRTSTSRPTISRMERGLPASTGTVLGFLSATGYEILIVPRGSRVTIEAAP